MLGVRCVVYVKRLGETYMTPNRRLVLLVYLLLLLNVLIKTRTVQAGNFKVVDISNAKKIQRRDYSFLLKAFVVSYGHFSTNTISVPRQWSLHSAGRMVLLGCPLRVHISYSACEVPWPQVGLTSVTVCGVISAGWWLPYIVPVLLAGECIPAL